MKIALVGNPNCGKTTLFNRLTGRRAKVSNMPGVTVERYEAPWKGQPGVQLVDLPGTYSLFAKADDERVTQRELLDPELQPDAVWIILDSAHVRSSLFLALQVLEMGFPSDRHHQPDRCDRRAARSTGSLAGRPCLLLPLREGTKGPAAHRIGKD